MDSKAKRHAEIQRICDWALYIHPVDGTSLRLGVTQDSLREAVQELRALGRTDRWRDAIRVWDTWLATQPDRLVWAVLEGATHAGYAAR